MLQNSAVIIRTSALLALLAGIRSIGRFFLFIAGGLVAIVVGAFMIRGTMHMWDNPNDDEND